MKRFTPITTKILNIIASDLGRPISDLNIFFLQKNFDEHIEKVFKTQIPYEKELKTKDNIWYLIRILLYQTELYVIDGIVITLVDITKLKQVQEEILFLEKLTHVINVTEDLHSAMECVLQIVCEFTNWTIGEIWFPNSKQTCLERQFYWHPSDGNLKDFVLPAEDIDLRRVSVLPTMRGSQRNLYGYEM